MNRLADPGATDDDITDLESDDFEDDERDDSPPRSLGWLLTLGGLIGFVASFVLTVDGIKMLKDPNYVPSCSIDSVLKCSTVMASPQASLFGFPNPLIGVATFPVVVLAGVLALTRVHLPAWFWRWMLVGEFYAMIFIGWLISQTLYEIRSLCPYCMVVWVVVIAMFWRTLGWSLSVGHYGDGAADSAIGRAVARWWWLFVIATYLLVFILVVGVFPWYFGL